MSPDLFNYYTEMILREINNEKGGGSNITNINKQMTQFCYLNLPVIYKSFLMLS